MIDWLSLLKVVFLLGVAAMGFYCVALIIKGMIDADNFDGD